MIYLRPEFISLMQDDTFWTWFAREIGGSFDIPRHLKDDDIVLDYAVLEPMRGGRRISLCWELYHAMHEQGLGVEADVAKRANMERNAETAELALVASPHSLKYFPRAKVLPIGVDTDFFRPPDHRPREKRLFWCGTDHPMKGRSRALAYAAERGLPITAIYKGSMPQPELAAEMRRHTHIVMSGTLVPLFLVEWEALASGLEPIDISGVERDVDISGNPRAAVFRNGWSRHQVAQHWRRILAHRDRWDDLSLDEVSELHA